MHEHPHPSRLRRDTVPQSAIVVDRADWASLSHEEKNQRLILRQKELLDMFLERGAISQAQHDKSLHDLIEKMGKQEN